jgi:hypothetical protein
VLTALALALVWAPAAQAGETSLGSCAWVRNDPVAVNVLYPDEDAVYYIAALPTPRPGIRWSVRGEFPHARYMSFVSYNGLPMDALLDVDIAPDAGSFNPFGPGADRTAAKRSYSVRLLETPAPADPAQRAANTVYVGGGQLGSPAPAHYLYYRIYVPDRGTAPRAGVPLPEIVVSHDRNVSQDLGALDCESLRDAAAQSPVNGLHTAYAGLSRPAQAPVTRAPATPEWSVESGLTAAALGPAGQEGAVKGGPGSNPHNLYLAAQVSRAHGEVLVIRGKAPSTPATFDGQPTMGTGDLRYWSFCQNGRTTRYVACLSDSRIALDPDGSYTVVVSDPSKRPPSAANWLPFGAEPEGQVLYRHMLPSAAFMPFSAQGADESVPLTESMGDFYPRAAYCTVAEFEADRCGL